MVRNSGSLWRNIRSVSSVARQSPRWLRWSLFALVLLLFILLPFVLFERPLEAWSQALLSGSKHAGWVAVGVVFLLAVDVVLPIPSSLVAAFAISVLGAAGGGAAVFVGLTAAAWAGYGLGRLGGTPLAERVAGKDELARASRLMGRHGYWVLVLCRGVPVLAEASTLFAGAVKQAPWAFFVITSVGNLGVAAAYATLGFFELPPGLDVVGPFVFALAIPALAWVAFRSLVASRPSP